MHTHSTSSNILLIAISIVHTIIIKSMNTLYSIIYSSSFQHIQRLGVIKTISLGLLSSQSPCRISPPILCLSFSIRSPPFPFLHSTSFNHILHSTSTIDIHHSASANPSSLPCSSLFSLHFVVSFFPVILTGDVSCFYICSPTLSRLRSYYLCIISRLKCFVCLASPTYRSYCTAIPSHYSSLH